MSDDLGPKPEARIQPKEPNPGGVDAIDAPDGPPQVADLDPEANPAVEDAAPDSIKNLDESEDPPKSDGASNPEKESPP